jgi:hypothetical protein
MSLYAFRGELFSNTAGRAPQLSPEWVGPAASMLESAHHRKAKKAGHQGQPDKCVFFDPYINSAYFKTTSSQLGCLGGHSGMGPPVRLFGAAAYANVPTKPTNSSNARSERFIDFLLRVNRGSLGNGYSAVVELDQVLRATGCDVDHSHKIINCAVSPALRGCGICRSAACVAIALVASMSLSRSTWISLCTQENGSSPVPLRIG